METKEKNLPSKIEPVPVNSPLLSDVIIVRDYTSGVDSQLSGPPPPDPAIVPGPGGGSGDPPPDTTPPPSGNEYELDPDARKMSDTTREFTFAEDLSSGPGAPSPGDKVKSAVDAEISDIPGGEGFVLPEASAKAFAEMIGNAVGIYVPKFSYEAVKIDMKNVRMHVREGNLSPEFFDVFELANVNTEEALKFDAEEIKMFKKSLKDYLEYKNVAIANPETAFWVTVAIMGTKQYYMINSLKKENRKLVLDALKITNPGMFKDYKEEGKARDNIADKKDQTEDKKTL